MLDAGPGEMREVAVIRASRALGDMLLAVPALRALRAARPDANLALIGLPWARAILDRIPYRVELLPFPGFPGIPNATFDASRTVEFLTRAQARGFDLAIQLHGNGLLSNPFVELLGARRTAGFYLPGQHCPDPGSYLPFDPHEHEVSRSLRLLARLGVPPRGEHLEFEVPGAARAVLARVPPRFALIHPGAAQTSKRWNAGRFAEVADELAGRGLGVVLTGSAGEREATAAVAARMRCQALDLAGSTSLDELAALLEAAAITVANDTGIAHLAGAVGAPTVVVFRWSERSRWAPTGDRQVALGDPDSLPAGGWLPVAGRCLRDSCVRLEREEAEVPPADVGAEEVLAAADRLLAG